VKSVVKKPSRFNFFRKITLVILSATGTISLVLLVLAFTPLPFHAWYSLGMKYAGINRPPDYIVVLGGGGMPSESGLMRCWYTAKVADRFPKAHIIIALPGDTIDTLSSVQLMKKELILRGIRSNKIEFENCGTNTRGQALNLTGLFSPTPFTPTPNNSSRVTRHASLLIITSPEHLCRAVSAFRKAGFLKVDGMPAFERAIESDITFNSKKIGGRKWIPDVGENISLRYGFWTQIRYEQLVLREYTAIAYYWMMGWI
jgi:uncharacterized SAM-binding protein YcdF (DUF218 family)